MAKLGCWNKDTHTGRGECWQWLNVFAPSRGKGKKGSRRAETNTCWLLLVKLWRGIEGWRNVFIPSASPSIPNPPTLPPHISILERRWMKGKTPQRQHFSLQTCADAFWRLLNCTWYRQASFSFKSKTDCFSQGRELLDKRNNKARTVQPSGGWCMKGVSLWIVRVCLLLCFLLYMPVCHKIMFVPMCFKCLHMQVTSQVCARSNHWSGQDHNIFLVYFQLLLSSTLHHMFTPPFPLISVPFSLSFFYFPLSLLSHCPLKWGLLGLPTRCLTFLYKKIPYRHGGPCLPS